MPKLKIEQWPELIETGKKSILDAALDVGVPFPHGCGSGECGQCKCQLLSGEVKREAASPDALSSAEIAQGKLLACRSRLVGDVSLRWLSQAAPLVAKKYTARVVQVEPLAHDVMHVTLALPETIHFHPGQFAKLGFAKLAPRSYSMANQPGSGQLEFHIRIVPDGLVSGFIASELKLGDQVSVEAPFGDAHWQGVSDAPVLLLAGGTGLAPIVAMLDAALAQGQSTADLHVYHGVRSARDLYTGEKLRKMAQQHGFSFHAVYSHEPDENGRHGHLHEVLASDFASLKSAQIYVAGPPPMVDAVRTLATQRGADQTQIRADAFYAAPEVKKGWFRRLIG